MGAQDKANPTGEARARKLLAWWDKGAGGKIAWGTPGDFRACVTLASEHMSPEKAKGFCANRHKAATGGWPGHAPAEEALAAGKKAVTKAEVPAAYVTAAGEVVELPPLRFEVRPGPELVVFDGADRVTVTKALVAVPSSARGRIHTERVSTPDGDGVGVEVAGHRLVWSPGQTGPARLTPSGAIVAGAADVGSVLVPEELPGGGRVRQWIGKARRARQAANVAQGAFDWDPAEHPRGAGGRFARVTVQPWEVKPGDKIRAHWTDRGPETAREVTAVTFDREALKLGHPVDARMKADGMDTPQFLARDHPIEVERPEVDPPDPFDPELRDLRRDWADAGFPLTGEYADALGPDLAASERADALAAQQEQWEMDFALAHDRYPTAAELADFQAAQAEPRPFGLEAPASVPVGAPGGALTGTVGARYDDPIPRLRDASPTTPTPLALPMTFDGELDLFAAPDDSDTPDVVTIPAWGLDRTGTFHAPPGAAARVEALAAFTPYGPDHSRALTDTLEDMDDAMRGGRPEMAERHLQAAERIGAEAARQQVERPYREAFQGRYGRWPTPEETAHAMTPEGRGELIAAGTMPSFLPVDRLR